MFERTPVRIERVHKQRVLVDFSGRSFVKGSASGAGCNCLIRTLLACLNDNNLRCVANIPWIRQELQKLFPAGENIVMEGNYLDLRNHWRSIIDLIGVSARYEGCDERNQIHARNFRVTSVLEEAARVVEEDGDGPIHLFTLNEGNYHFVPLIRNRERWRGS